MPCQVCRRDAGPLPPIPPWLAGVRDWAPAACSIVCLTLLSLRDKNMVDPTENERVALENASDMAGEYLENEGESDLAKLTRDQWMTLIEVVVTGFSDKLREVEGAGTPSR